MAWGEGSGCSIQRAAWIHRAPLQAFYRTLLPINLRNHDSARLRFKGAIPGTTWCKLPYYYIPRLSAHLDDGLYVCVPGTVFQSSPSWPWNNMEKLPRPHLTSRSVWNIRGVLCNGWHKVHVTIQPKRVAKTRLEFGYAEWGVNQSTNGGSKDWNNQDRLEWGQFRMLRIH